MSRKLYIIGNGFDLHHGIPSGYREFGAFLKKTDESTYKIIERYFNPDDDFWWEFENRLADLDADSLIDDASTFLVGYGAEDWSDSYHHDYQYEINRVVSAVSSTTRQHFANWIRQLRIPTPTTYSKMLLPIDKQAGFLNFNYTPTLQRLYKIPDNQILHIHGMSDNEASDIILGHGWEPEENQNPYRFEVDPENADTRVIEGQSLIDKYFRSTFKPTEEIITNNQNFFSSLADVDTIFIMGHSLSSVDHAYFYEVKRHLSTHPVKWNVSYFVRQNGTSDLIKLKNHMIDLGVLLDDVRFDLIDNLTS